MLPTINLGPLVLPTAGLVYIIGAWIVLSVIERSAKALDLDAESTYGLAAVSLVSAFIGARLVFVALHWSAFQDNLTGIVWPLNSGYDLWGGLVFGLAAAVLYGRAKQLPLAATLDALAPGILVGFALLSLADLLAGPGYGKETNAPWGINLFGITRHPVQIYEIIIALIALGAWLWVYKRHHLPGQLFLIAMAAYAAGRLLVDAFRANSPLTGGGYHIIQLISLAIVLTCVFLLGRMVTQEVPGQKPSD